MKRFLTIIGLSIGGLSAMATAQVPFINRGGVTAFDPEIDVVNSGVINDVQAVVSADRKYVTLNMRPSNSTLVEIHTIQFGGPGTGLVGGARAGDQPADLPANTVRPATVNSRKQPVIRTSPQDIHETFSPPSSPADNPLNRPGMTRL